jgi:hypothetical protein
VADVRVERIEGAEIEGDKRQYAPFVLKWTCKCGADCERDLTDSYLSYPRFGCIEQTHLYCSKCDAETAVNLRLSLALEVVADEVSRG